MKLRGMIVSVMLLLLSFVIAGSMNEVGQVIKYPATTRMTITKYSGVDKVATLDEINTLAKKSGLILYKPFVTDKGVSETAELGVKQAHLEDLKALSLTGFYYLSTDSGQFRQSISNIGGLQSNFISLNLLMFPLFSFYQGVSAPSIWILFFVFFISVYAVEMSYIKRGMVHRSLGRFGHYIKTVFLSYLAFLLGAGSVVIGVFALLQGSANSVYVEGFALSLGISCLILIFLVFVAILLFTLVLKTQAISSILKNRYVNRLGSVIYLVGILLSIVIFAQTVNTSLQTATHFTNYEQALSKWKSVRSFVLPSFDDGSIANMNAEHVFNQNYEVSQTQKELALNQSFADKDFVFAHPSTFSAAQEKVYQAATSQANSQIVRVKTDSSLSSHMLYVSRGFVLLNEDLYPKNTFGKTDSQKLITLYIPQSLTGKVQSIENNIIAESFPVVTPKVDSSKFYVNIVPDNQETFLLNYNPFVTPYLTNSLPSQTAKNEILVQINYKALPSLTSDVMRVAGNITVPYGGNPSGMVLIRQSVLVDKLKDQGLQNQLTSVDNISADAALLAQTVTTQLQGTVMVMVAIVLSSIFILWKYLKNLYLRFSKPLVITYLFTGESYRQEFQILLPILSGILVAAGLSGYLTASWAIILFILALYLIEIFLVVIINQRQLKRKRIQIVKDSLE